MLTRQAAQRSQDDVLVGGVELTGRLVGEDQRRPPGDGGGDRDPLLLAARERRGAVLGAGAEAELDQRLGPPGAARR